MLLLSIIGLATFTLAENAPSIPSSGLIQFTIAPSATHQTISGFGFCEAFQRAHSIINLPEPARTEVLDLLFHPTKGAGFSIHRIGLGSSPDSRGDHMNTPQPNATSVFKWDGNDSGQVWVAKRAMQYGVKTFIADAWSAPGYMKTNGRDDMGGWLCGVRGEGKGSECKGASWIEEYAEYLAKYVKAWTEEGISIQYLGFLNEPNLIKGYATMQSDGYQAADVVPAMAAALQRHELGNVGLSCCEGQGWSMQRQLLAEMQDAGVEGALSLVSTHTYKGSPPKPDGPFNTTLPVWVTEISPIMDRLGMTQTWYRNNSENEGLLHAVNMHEALTTGNVSAYIYWIGSSQSSADVPFIWAPNPVGGDRGQNMWGENANNTIIEVPAGKALYTIGSTYWASAHFSRFIRPGAQRIEISVGSVSPKEDYPESKTPILATAFLNLDGSIVVQAINNGDDEFQASFLLMTGEQWSHWGDKCQVASWVTDGEEKLKQNHISLINGPSSTESHRLPRRSLTTFLIRNCSNMTMV